MPTTDPELRMLLKRQAQQAEDLKALLSNGFESVVSELSEVKKEVSILRSELVGPATGHDQIPMETHTKIVSNVSLAYGAVIVFITGLKIFGIG